MDEIKSFENRTRRLVVYNCSVLCLSFHLAFLRSVLEFPGLSHYIHPTLPSLPFT